MFTSVIVPSLIATITALALFGLGIWRRHNASPVTGNLMLASSMLFVVIAMMYSWQTFMVTVLAVTFSTPLMAIAVASIHRSFGHPNKMPYDV